MNFSKNDYPLVMGCASLQDYLPQSSRRGVPYQPTSAVVAWSYNQFIHSEKYINPLNT